VGVLFTVWVVDFKMTAFAEGEQVAHFFSAKAVIGFVMDG
jgi:hypothetical protein